VIVVFLDIDGVLVSFMDLDKRCEKYQEHVFRDYSVQALNNITNYLDAKIVLSSSWRSSFPQIEKFREFAKERGIEAEIIDYTPNMYHEEGRAKEISTWLESNETDYHIEDFIIIDDETIGMSKQEHLFEGLYPGYKRYKNMLTTNSYRCLDEYDFYTVCRNFRK